MQVKSVVATASVFAMAEQEETACLLKNFVIPDYILLGHSGPHGVSTEAPKYPVLVFINARSGGQLGTQLLTSYRVVLNPSQVFNLSEHEPSKVLHDILGHLENLKAEGDKFAANVRNNLRIIVAGGDGTAGWLLGTVGDMKLSRPPPIATVPLGTGNNLPYSFGWGKRNPVTDRDSVIDFLHKVSKAKPMNIDSWHVVMKIAIPSGDFEKPEPIELPQSLHPFKRASNSEEGHLIYRGGFWNYFSIGMDAQVSYAFHHARQEHPERFKNQLINQGTYAMLGCTQGWFCASCSHPSSKNINQLGKIKIARHNSNWEDLDVSKSIRSIVMLNLPSFSGGLNPWGDPSDKKSIERGLTPPLVNDGLLEIVGFRDGWHGLALLTPNGHGTRLAQAHKVRIEFHKGTVDHTYLRMDGEPWLQPFPKDDGMTVIEITHLSQVVMLATEDCIAKAVPHEAGNVQLSMKRSEQGISTSQGSELGLKQMEGDEANLDSDNSSSDEMEARRKFGATNTFKGGEN
eukprot:c27375_g1_i1 orf=289-1833(-)